MAQFDGRLLDDFARGGLPRFLRQDDGRQRPGLGLGVSRADLRDDLLGFDVAGHDEENIVGRVFFPVVGNDVLGLKFVENVRVADDGEAIRAAV